MNPNIPTGLVLLGLSASALVACGDDEPKANCNALEAQVQGFDDLEARTEDIYRGACEIGNRYGSKVSYDAVDKLTAQFEQGEVLPAILVYDNVSYLETEQGTQKLVVPIQISDSRNSFSLVNAGNYSDGIFQLAVLRRSIFDLQLEKLENSLGDELSSEELLIGSLAAIRDISNEQARITKGYVMDQANDRDRFKEFYEGNVTRARSYQSVSEVIGSPTIDFFFDGLSEEDIDYLALLIVEAIDVEAGFYNTAIPEH